jgi:hypothetical protein
MSSAQRSLVQIQHWMQSVITHSDGVPSGVSSVLARNYIDIGPEDLEGVIRPSRELSSTDRLRVYGNAYFSRLLECLRTEFPALLYVLGEETFHSFALEYLHRHPSRSYTLSTLGAGFPQHLADTRPAREDPLAPDYADFLIDLARLERAYTEVFDLPGPEDGERLSLEKLQSIPEDAWSDVRLVAYPCVRLISFEFPVNEYASAVRHKAPNASIPKAAETYLVLTRRDYVIRHLPVSAPEYSLLVRLLAGEPLGQAIAQTFSENSADLAIDLFATFQSWTAAPFFHRIAHA